MTFFIPKMNNQGCIVLIRERGTRTGVTMFAIGKVTTER